MHDYFYVPESEWKPVKKELIEKIHRLQEAVREDFTFQFHFVGSSRRNMITQDRKSNVGYDFDVNIEVNDPEENYTPEEIRRILRLGLDKVNRTKEVNVLNVRYRDMHSCMLRANQYDCAEDSSRVLTIKVKDKDNAQILHSCDFCIVFNCRDGRQQYIHFNKQQNSYTWDYQGKRFSGLDERVEWIKNKGLWGRVRELYLEKKNRNEDPNKRSMSIFAETINEVFQKYGEKRGSL